MRPTPDPQGKIRKEETTASIGELSGDFEEIKELENYRLPDHVCTDNEALILLQMSAADISERFSIYVDTPEGPVLKQILVAIDLLAKQGKITAEERRYHEDFWIKEIQKSMVSDVAGRMFAEAAGQIGTIGEEIAQNAASEKPPTESITVKLQKILLRNFHHRSFQKSEKISSVKTPNVLGILFSHHARGEISLENTMNLGRKFLAQMHQAIMDRAKARAIMTPMSTPTPEHFYTTVRHILGVLLENSIITEDQAVGMLDFSHPLDFPDELREAVDHMMPTLPSAAREVTAKIVNTQTEFQILNIGGQASEPASHSNAPGNAAENDFGDLLADIPDERPPISTLSPSADTPPSFPFDNAPDTDTHLGPPAPTPPTARRLTAEVSLIAEASDLADPPTDPPPALSEEEARLAIMEQRIIDEIHAAVETSAEALRDEVAQLIEAISPHLASLIYRKTSEAQVAQALEATKTGILTQESEDRHGELLEGINGAADDIHAAITRLTHALQTPPPKASRLPAFGAGVGLGALAVAAGVWLSGRPVDSSPPVSAVASAASAPSSPATYNFDNGELEITYADTPNKTTLLKVNCDDPCKVSYVPKADKYPAYLSIQVGKKSGLVSLPPSLPSDLTTWKPQTTHFQGADGTSLWNTHQVALIDGQITISAR